MLALADHAHEDGTGIRPSIKRIAWKTGYAERSVQSIMSQLRELGILIVSVPATHNTPNEYRFDWSVATPKRSFNELMDAAKGRKHRGAESVEGCNSRAIGVQ